MSTHNVGCLYKGNKPLMTGLPIMLIAPIVASKGNKLLVISLNNFISCSWCWFNEHDNNCALTQCSFGNIFIFLMCHNKIIASDDASNIIHLK